jgi:hypothetical protein
MNNPRIHCEAGAKDVVESGWVEKPPVGIVPNAWATAS